MKNIQEKMYEIANIRSKYIKYLRMNYLHFKTKSNKKIESKKNLEKNIYNKFHKAYLKNENYYNIIIINEIITNQKSHLVAEFKDFLIKDDISEFIFKFYPTKESKKLLLTIFNYYNQTSVVFPNYILLSENKYLYKNIKRKQKLINILEEKDDKDNLNKKKSLYDTNDLLEKSSKVFNSNILDSILNESNTSQIKKSIFGISPENSNFNDNDGNNKLNILVNNINQIEENHYNDFLNKKKLKLNDNKNVINIKNIMDNVNNRNVIKRNRNNTVEITKFTKYTKFIQNKSHLKNINKKRAKTETIKNELNNNNIIFNNIYKTDLYLNINNNIIIKQDKNKSNEDSNKLKLKKLNISKDFLHPNKAKNKFIKKNDINNLLLSLESINKEIFNNYKISESRNENNKNAKNKTEGKKINHLSDFINNKNNKNIKHRKIKTDIMNENFSKSKSKTKNKLLLNIQTKKTDKIMINNFKNTLNNLMSIINKKKFKRNINRRQNIITNNYKSGYSSRYSSSLNKKDKRRFIDIFHDSMLNIKSKSMKIKDKKIQNIKESITTFRRNISNDNTLINNQKSAKYQTIISCINEIKPRKNKIIINKLNQNQNKIYKKKINSNNDIDNITHNKNKNKEIFSLTTREQINIYNRNKFNINVKKNKSNFNNILFGKPKSFRFKKDYFENIIHNNKTKNFNLSMKDGINYHKIIKTDFNNILKEKFYKRNKSVKDKRNYPKIDTSLIGKINTNINLNINKNNNNISIANFNKEIEKEMTKETENKNSNKNPKKVIKGLNHTYTDKNNNSNRINYSQIEKRKKKFKNINNNRKEYKINDNIFKHKSKPNVSSYTDRLYQKKF